MPTGGSTALNDEEWEYVRGVFDVACKNGLQYEWLQYFAGGLVYDKKGVYQAANDAAIEWDI